MKVSDSLRGRSKAFNADVTYLEEELASSNLSDAQRRSITERRGGYRIVAAELSMLADEYHREGL